MTTAAGCAADGAESDSEAGNQPTEATNAASETSSPTSSPTTTPTSSTSVADDELPEDDDNNNSDDNQDQENDVDEPRSAGSDPAAPSEGLATLVSDEADVEPRPLAGQILIVPTARQEALLTAGEADPDDAGGLAYTRFTVDQAILDELGATVQDIAEDGSFTPPTEPSIVCLANSFPSDPPGLPHDINGCAEADGTGSIHLTFGEGGVQVRPLS